MDDSSSETEAPPSLLPAQDFPALARGLDVVPGTLPHADTDFAAVYAARLNALEAELNALRPDVYCEPSSIMCHGILLDWPEEVWSNYHFTLSGQPYVKWLPPDAKGRIKSKQCAVFVEATIGSSPPSSCKACTELLGNTKLAEWLTRARDDGLHLTPINDKCLTQAQQMRRLAHRRAMGKEIYFKSLDKESKIRRLQGVATASGRVIAAVATRNIPRLQVIARNLIEKGATPQTVAREFELAANGCGRKGNWDQIEYQKAFLLLILGGRRALRFNMIENGGPSHRTLMRQQLYRIPRHIVCSGEVKATSLHENLRRFFGSLSLPEDYTRCLWHGMIDNVNCQKALSYVEADGTGAVMARESKFTGEKSIKSAADARRFEEALDKDDLQAELSKIQALAKGLLLATTL